MENSLNDSKEAGIRIEDQKTKRNGGRTKSLNKGTPVGSKSFRPAQLFKVTEIKQLCYFST